MQLPPFESLGNVWIENRNAPEDSGAPEWNFGTCLWSPARNKSGADSYAIMRAVRPGDLVLHLLKKRWADDATADKRLCGLSIVAAECEEVATPPPAPGEWGGRRAYYRVPLRDFRPIERPVSIATFGAANAAKIREEAADGATSHYPFATYGAGVRIAQGRYLARCTQRLYELLSSALTSQPDGVSMKQEGLQLLQHLEGIPQEVLSSPAANKFDPGSAHPVKTWFAEATGLDPEEIGVKFVTSGRLRHATGEPKPAKLGVFVLDGALTDRFVEASLPNVGPRRRFSHALVVERVDGRCRASAVIGSPSDPVGAAIRALFPDTQAQDVAGGGTQAPALNLILYGPPGTGKTFCTVDLALEICGMQSETREEAEEKYRALVESGRVRFVTFHQSFSYEDFVEGIKPVLKNGSLTYESQAGVFKEICDRACASADNFVLIIDEINRANVSKVFGELISLLEPEKRIGGSEEKKTRMPYSRTDFCVPPNLFIVGTMNSADRSVTSIDIALRRRFAFIEMLPRSDLVRDQGPVEGFDVAQLLDVINRRVEFLVDRDHTIGHSYFMNLTSLDDLGAVLRERVVPLLQEYFHGDLSKVAWVLGCGFDDEGRSTNAKPILRATLDQAGTVIGGSAPFDDRVRVEVDDDFLRARGDELRPYLKGILSS